MLLPQPDTESCFTAEPPATLQAICLLANAIGFHSLFFSLAKSTSLKQIKHKHADLEVLSVASVDD